MSSLDMLDILGGIDAAYIDESKDTVQNRKTVRISRWLPALAAERFIMTEKLRLNATAL